MKTIKRRTFLFGSLLSVLTPALPSLKLVKKPVDLRILDDNYVAINGWVIPKEQLTGQTKEKGKQNHAV